MDKALNRGLGPLVLAINVVWGLAGFFQGLAGSFTLNSIRLSESLAVLIFGFLGILPLSILAFWSPKSSVALLMVSLAVVEVAAYADGGLRGLSLAAKKLALRNIVLLAGYIYLAYLRSDFEGKHR